MKALGGICTLALLATCLQGFPATAQGTTNSNASSTADRVQTRQLESLLGRDIRTPEGDSGRIIDLLTDHDGKLQAAVVEMGGFLGIGTRKIAIDWRSFTFNTTDPQSFVTLEVRREQMRLAPEYSAPETVVVLKAKD